MSSQYLSVSNLENTLYENNKPGAFRNEIDLTLLDPALEYEVALINVTYVKSHFNFTEDKEYWLEYANGAGVKRKKIIEPGYYEPHDFTPERIGNNPFAEPLTRNNRENDQWYVNAMHPDSIWDDCTVSFDPAQYKFKIEFRESRLLAARNKSQRANLQFRTLKLSDDLAEKMGFNATTYEWPDYPNDAVIHADRKAINFQPINYFYLQSNIMKASHQFGGKGQWQVLGIIPWDTRARVGERINYTVEKKIWFPLERGNSSPHFLFNTEQDNNLLFEFGTTWCTLEIRPVPT